jgi:hypothetical protein
MSPVLSHRPPGNTILVPHERSSLLLKEHNWICCIEIACVLWVASRRSLFNGRFLAICDFREMPFDLRESGSRVRALLSKEVWRRGMDLSWPNLHSRTDS